MTQPKGYILKKVKIVHQTLLMKSIPSEAHRSSYNLQRTKIRLRTQPKMSSCIAMLLLISIELMTICCIKDKEELLLAMVTPTMKFIVNFLTLYEVPLISLLLLILFSYSFIFINFYNSDSQVLT